MPRPSVTWWGILCLVVPMGICNAVHAVEAGDTCATAGVIAESGSYNFDTTGASGDDPCGVNIPTVWYQFTPVFPGVVSADLCGSSYDTFLSVFAGNDCPAGCDDGPLAANDDFCGYQSGVEFIVNPGSTYYLAISGYGASDFGPGVLNFEYTIVAAGDTCAEAGLITKEGTYSFDTTGASNDDPCRPGIPTVWYRYAPTASGTATVDLCESSFDTFLTVFPGDDCPQGCDDGRLVGEIEFCNQYSRVVFPVTAGMSYYLPSRGATTRNSGPDC